MMNYPHDYDRCPGPSKCNHPDHAKIRELEAELADLEVEAGRRSVSPKAHSELLAAFKNANARAEKAEKMYAGFVKMSNEVLGEITRWGSRGSIDYPASIEALNEVLGSRRVLEARVAELDGLLREWLETPFFEYRSDWNHWVRAFRPRVKAVIEAREREAETDG